MIKMTRMILHMMFFFLEMFRGEISTGNGRARDRTRFFYATKCVYILRSTHRKSNITIKKNPDVLSVWLQSLL